MTVTADAGQGKVYGNADPALAYHITSGSLAFSDAFSGALTRAAGENVGQLRHSAGHAGAEHQLHPGLRRGRRSPSRQRPVTVTADAKTKVYGNADPALTYHITSGSLAFSDAFSGALTRAAGENVGHLRHHPGHAGAEHQLHAELRRRQSHDHDAAGHRDRGCQVEDLRRRAIRP